MLSFGSLLAAFNRVMTKRWPDLSKRKRAANKYDWEFLCTTTWFAVDADQHVAAFENGEIPAVAMLHIERWRQIEQLLDTLPQTREDELLITRETHAADHRRVDRARRMCSSDEMIEHSWSSVSTSARYWTGRGLFSYWGVNSGSYSTPDCYARAKPLEPITLRELPTEVHEIISTVISPVRFNQISRFHINSLFANAAK